jgi:hypothetical protein
MVGETKKKLEDLAGQWESRARRALCDAEQEKDPMGKRLVEHGAMCYFNCAQEIKEVLISVSLRSSAIEEEGQK